MAGGRPLKFTSPEALNDAAKEYFTSHLKGALNEGKPLTISGLAYSLDVCTQTLLNYTEKDEFFAPIKRLKQLIEITYEEKLHGNSCTGAIFALKNLGWKDTQEVNQNNTGVPQIVITKNYHNKAE